MDKFPLNVLDSMLEWSPIVMCGELALDSVLAHGIKVDHVFIHKENLDRVQKVLSNQMPVKTWSVEDGDFLSPALQILSGNEQYAVNIVGEAQSMNQRLTRVMELLNKFHVVYFDMQGKHMLLQHFPFSKWYPEGTALMLSSINEATNVALKGTKNDFLEHIPTKGLKTSTVNNGMMTIESDQPIVLSEIS
jgi:hypothetical protein